MSSAQDGSIPIASEMSTIDYSIERVSRVLQTVESLKESEFPYKQSREALDDVECILQQTLENLTDTNTFADEKGFEVMVQTVCAESLETIFNYLPLLGFILRSTNVRNAFEVHGPVSRLAKKLLGSDTKLLLASEWDYSPLAYSDIPGMASFILLGLPSPESSNPLLIPLAGHEFGHALWSHLHLTNEYNGIITSSIQSDIDGHNELLEQLRVLYRIPHHQTDVWRDIIFSITISPAVTWAVRQAEETFCDFVGLRIFGESFLHSFAYLLCPGEEYRQVEYPSITMRVENLLSAAGKWKLPLPTDYGDQFMLRSSSPPSVEVSDKSQFQLELADRALSKHVNDLRDLAEQRVGEKGIDLPDVSIVTNIRKKFDLTIPFGDSQELVNILNAGWTAYLDDTLWSEYHHIPKDVRKERLKELILKNIEILDLEQRGLKSQ